MLKKKTILTCLLVGISFSVSTMLWTAHQDLEIAKHQPAALGRHLAEKTDGEDGQLTNGERRDPDEAAQIPGLLPKCPLYPFENLKGRLAGAKNCVAPEDIIKVHFFIEKGGRVRPPNCTAVEKVAIVIPFRNRYTHLYILLNNLFPLLRRQLVDARVFLIEQAEPTPFNRASLFNTGFLEALKFDAYDCFIFHDVDLIPLNDRNLYRCLNNPVHFAVAMDKYNYALPYQTYFGGVVGFTTEQYRTINGNSNLYFGWGGEDDDLYERIVGKGYEIARPDSGIGKYDMLRHAQDKGNEDNCGRRQLLKTARERQDKEGLNTAQYTVITIHQRPLFTCINVRISLEEVLATVPQDIRQVMTLARSHAKHHACNFSRGAPIHV